MGHIRIHALTEEQGVFHFSFLTSFPSYNGALLASQVFQHNTDFLLDAVLAPHNAYARIAHTDAFSAFAIGHASIQ